MKTAFVFLMLSIASTLSHAAPGGDFLEMRKHIGHYEGNVENDFDALPNCTVDVVTDSRGRLTVTITPSHPIRVFDKNVPGGVREIPSASQLVSPYGLSEINGSETDMTAWNVKTHWNFAMETSTARFFVRESGRLRFVQLQYSWDDFGFFKGSEISYQAGCYQLERKN